MVGTSAGWRLVVMAAVVAAVSGAGVGWGAESSSDKTRVAGVAGNVTPDAKGSEEQAKAEWARISVEIRNAEDLETIVGIHGRFLDKYPDGAVAEKVRASQEVYEALVKSKAIKFRGKWVAAEQVDVLQRQWRQDARPALELYRDGKWKEALEAAVKVGAKDRENGEALAIAGVSAYRLHQMPGARGYFEKLVALDAASVLAENNLAVIAFELKQPAAGIMHYGKAIVHGAENRMLLDNIAEALQAYLVNGGDKNSTPFRELKTRAAGAEREMIGVMGKKGLLRHGATWVTQAQLDKILQNISNVKYQMQVLDKQYAELQQRVAAAQQGLKQANAEYQGALNTLTEINMVLDRVGSGQSMQNIMARKNWEEQRLARAAQQKTQCEQELETLSKGAPQFLKAAADLKALLVAADRKYTGVQQIMVPEDLREAPAIAGGIGATSVEEAVAKAVKPAALVLGAKEPGAAGGAGGVAGAAGGASGDSSEPSEPAIVKGNDYGNSPPEIRLPQVPYAPYSPPPGFIVSYGPWVHQETRYTPDGPSAPSPGNYPRILPLPVAVNVPPPIAPDSVLVYVPRVKPEPYVPPRRTGIAQQPGTPGPLAIVGGLQSGQPLDGPAQVPYQMLPTPSGTMPLQGRDTEGPYDVRIVPVPHGSGGPFMQLLPPGNTPNSPRIVIPYRSPLPTRSGG